MTIHRPLLNSTDPGKSRLKAGRAVMGSPQQSLKFSGAAGEGKKQRPASIMSGTSQSLLGGGGKGREKPSPQQQEVYTLIYDPRLQTLSSNIPNIPEPGTAAAEGFASTAAGRGVDGWTRVEALNVHFAILNTLSSVAKRGSRSEIERALRTARGWWVVWLKLPASTPTATPTAASASFAEERGSSITSGNRDTQIVEASDSKAAGTTEDADEASSTRALRSPRPQSPHNLQLRLHQDPNARIAIVVRKAVDTPGSPMRASQSKQQGSIPGSRAVSSMLEVMSLGFAGGRSEDDDLGDGTADGWGPPSALGGGLGLGFDARGYVEGLLGLER